jgi:hypothetical protein
MCFCVKRGPEGILEDTPAMSEAKGEVDNHGTTKQQIEREEGRDGARRILVRRGLALSQSR